MWFPTEPYDMQVQSLYLSAFEVEETSATVSCFCEWVVKGIDQTQEFKI